MINNNYQIARKIGVPVVVLPVNAVWMLTSGAVLSIVKAISEDCSVTKYGKSFSFQKSTEAPKPGHVSNHRDSLALILIFGPKFLTNRFLPKSWIRVGQANSRFQIPHGING